MMPKYKFYGLITLTGARFFVMAPDKAAAVRRASDGDFDEYDVSNGDVGECDIDTGTCEPMD
jgi:hypothetical protein